MHRMHAIIGDHCVRFATNSQQASDWVRTRYQVLGGESEGWESSLNYDLSILIMDGYGEPFSGYDVDIQVQDDKVTYHRPDYCIEVDSNYREAYVRVFDDFALKHAMLTLYGAHIVHHEWGLLIHSSCVVENGQAYLFSGRSGAGKSTVAQLSVPRRLLSDEATLVRIRTGEIRVFDSPFRSETTPEFVACSYPVAGIHMLRQADYIGKSEMTHHQAVSELLDKVFYWSYAPAETIKAMRMYHILASVTPVYELHFQKNNLFWEAIS